MRTVWCNRKSLNVFLNRSSITDFFFFFSQRNSYLYTHPPPPPPPPPPPKYPFILLKYSSQVCSLADQREKATRQVACQKASWWEIWWKIGNWSDFHSESPGQCCYYYGWVSWSANFFQLLMCWLSFKYFGNPLIYGITSSDVKMTTFVAYLPFLWWKVHYGLFWKLNKACDVFPFSCLYEFWISV